MRWWIIFNEPPVLVQDFPRLRELVLNRPQVLNALNLEMIRLLAQALNEAKERAEIQFVLLRGAGERGFCTGGDLKALAQAVAAGDREYPTHFFREEYALDLGIHRFPKPVLVLADGIVMGGGLGLAAGADLIVATEQTRMAMPETRIGFFPDVGATGWLHDRCLPGYPVFLALTGFELKGAETVRQGLATHLVRAARLEELHRSLENFPEDLPPSRPEAAARLHSYLMPFREPAPPALPRLDAWVARHFAGKKSMLEIQELLDRCPPEDGWCGEVRRLLAERSPTALALTLKLLRRHQGRPLEEVFAGEAEAAQRMVFHPDYVEGIRARILDKDDRPSWQPVDLEV